MLSVAVVVKDALRRFALTYCFVRRSCLVLRLRVGKFLYSTRVEQRRFSYLKKSNLVIIPKTDNVRFLGVPGRIRTYGLLVRNQTLYPLSYGDMGDLNFTIKKREICSHAYLLLRFNTAFKDRHGKYTIQLTSSYENLRESSSSLEICLRCY